MNRRLSLAVATAAAVLALAGCGSTSGGAATGTPSSSVDPSAAACTKAGGTWDGFECSGEASSAPSAPASDTSGSSMCTTKACIASDLDKSLVGGVAQDEAVATKVVCSKSSVKFHKAADSYSAWCVVTYSDGSQAQGTGNLLVSQQKVTFQPSGT